MADWESASMIFQDMCLNSWTLFVWQKTYFYPTPIHLHCLVMSVTKSLTLPPLYQQGLVLHQVVLFRLRTLMGYMCDDMTLRELWSQLHILHIYRFSRKSNLDCTI